MAFLYDIERTVSVFVYRSSFLVLTSSTNTVTPERELRSNLGLLCGNYQKTSG